ncbi:hypothetical protein BgiBS90_027975 [Biomphalaria glabrata]|nr:hypothetical protein BgiBS90_027975 [Biomphalaria glabrata]
MQHLPENHRDPDLFQLIKCAAELTVRIIVGTVSPHRPEFWPDTNQPFPFYDMRGKEVTTAGSGEISVFKFINGAGFDGRGSPIDQLGNKYVREYTTCPCKSCRKSETPSNAWWEIIVYTASHVVFDEIEARLTSCRMFYDDEESPAEILSPMTLDYVNKDREVCILKHWTCQQLGQRLYDMAQHKFTLRQKLWEKYKVVPDDNLNFIISHPHGCFKTICIGKWMDNIKISERSQEFNFTRLTYTTPTCPGSSGAWVHCVAFGGDHVHFGAFQPGLNISSTGLFRKQPPNASNSASGSSDQKS